MANLLVYNVPTKFRKMSAICLINTLIVISDFYGLSNIESKHCAIYIYI